MGCRTLSLTLVQKLVSSSVMDEAYRLEMSEKLGTGFNVPSCTECPEEEKEATGAVASK
jgi:hypothetical protein